VSGKLSYANVMSTLAVFLALGGGGFAIATAVKKNSVGSKQVKNEALTNKDLKNGVAVGTDEVIEESLGAADLGLGSVGSDELADGAVGSGEIADAAVGSGEVADGSLQPGDLAAPEPLRVVGTAGEPTFGNGGDGDCGWVDNNGFLGGMPVTFFKDRDGVVHLSGIAAAANGSGGDGACDNSGGVDELLNDFRIFTLPPGYRPPRPIQIVTSSFGAFRTLVIGGETDMAVGGQTFPAGAVIETNGMTGPVALEGLSFRAAAESGL
jgi:hypothetical protein